MVEGNIKRGNRIVDYLLDRCYADECGVKENRSMAIYYLKEYSNCERCVSTYGL